MVGRSILINEISRHRNCNFAKLHSTQHSEVLPQQIITVIVLRGVFEPERLTAFLLQTLSTYALSRKINKSFD